MPFCLRQNFSVCRNTLDKIFFRTLFIQNLGFNGSGAVAVCFFWCFSGVFSSCRNVLSAAFVSVGFEKNKGFVIAAGSTIVIKITGVQIMICLSPRLFSQYVSRVVFLGRFLAAHDILWEKQAECDHTHRLFFRSCTAFLIYQTEASPSKFLQKLKRLFCFCSLTSWQIDSML